MATIQDAIHEPNPTSAPAPGRPTQRDARPRTADARAESVRAKKKRRRASHKIALRRSHSNG